ncbi:ABC type multidrug transport system [endosymbiont of Acanthamoeba sp. UWC8]|uniref:ABC transporter ATP-binding protein n=1 Tax=endosymbiont of Acanthamoeba sp. UWC8 TaxID=86106 RepID=UPI0004D10BDF|nr:ABC transporter transmembrane domain-containing protein [endosymbiont of Acanthamoeba sp. UWC8]AIF81074.1 ABC type multidrug transport system [endosymbiont of Acanthamoeba sp. UWC8]
MFQKKNKKSKYDSSLYLIGRLFSEHVKLQGKQIQFAIFCMIIISVTTSIGAWLMQPVLDDIFVKKDLTMLYIVPFAVVVNAIIKGIASFLQSYTMKKIGQKIISDIQLRLYEHLIYADTNFLTDYASGNLISRFTNDINAMRKTVSDVVTSGVMELFTLIGLIGVMFYQSFSLAIIALLMIPIAFLPIIRLGKRMRKIARNIQEELGGFTVRLDETFQNTRIIKSYCREEYEISRANRIIDRFLELYKKGAYVESASSPIMETLGGIAIATIIWYGGLEVISGHTTPGAFFSFVAALLMAYRPLKAISQLNTSLQEGLAACKRLFTMLDEEPAIYDDITLPEAKFKSYNIEFKNVFFSYKNDIKILDGVNMFIPQEKTIALVGTSGSGKTTILNLLQRLYDPNYGEILIDGKDISKIRIRSLRDSMALVSQEVALFDDTIRENIRYGKLNATEEEITDAALAAAAHDFIINLPEGYDTQIGQNGVKLSGGQRQRIAIARAILKNAPILLMDEATSALDAISEKQVQMALEYLKKGRTTIVIAHRLSTIESADIIYVISEGKVSEFGSHEELLSLGKEYAHLYEEYKSDGK